MVFLKGCPLRCRWCLNPESWNSFPELGFIRARCNQCKECVAVCPTKAITIGPDSYPLIDRGSCDGCGQCTEYCYTEALQIYGKAMATTDVLEVVARDIAFYQRSGGGVTFSGGEPLMQPEFLFSVLNLCQAAGIHTTIETCGYASPVTFKSALLNTDYLLFDVKHCDPTFHLRYTGKSNKLILRNLQFAAASGAHLLVRMPLVPYINDNEDNIKATAELIKSLGSTVEGIELMPYHRLGLSKYEALGRQYAMQHITAIEMSKVEHVQRLFKTLKISCSISK